MPREHRTQIRFLVSHRTVLAMQALRATLEANQKREEAFHAREIAFRAIRSADRKNRV